MFAKFDDIISVTLKSSSQKLNGTLKHQIAFLSKLQKFIEAVKEWNLENQSKGWANFSGVDCQISELRTSFPCE